MWSTASTGLRRRTAAWISWKPVASTSGPDEPHTAMPPAASAHDSDTRAPDPAATPRQPPSLVTTPPARIARTVAARLAATIRPGRAGGEVPLVGVQPAQPAGQGGLGGAGQEGER